MHTSKIRFSKSSLEDLKPQQKCVFYFDTEVSGLALRVLPSGYKSFYLYKRLKGKDYRIKIGSISDISLQRARDLATHYKEDILSGKKLHKGVTSENKLTLKEMYDFFLNERRTYLAHSTYKEYQKLWKEHCQKLGLRLAKDITSAELKEFHYNLTVKNGIPYSANRVIMLLKAIYNTCIREGLFEQFNPCLAVKLNPEAPRIRALSDDEAQRLFKVLKNYPDAKSKNAVLLLLFTGARKSNVLSMRWADVDLQKGIWLIPKTKTSRNEPIALVPQAIDVLKEMQHISTNQYVFSSYSKTGHLTAFEANWEIIKKQANIKHLRLHDLRHTLATRLVAAGVPTFAVKKILTHKTIQSTQVYVNLGVEDVRSDLIKTVNKLTGKE